MKYYKYVQDNIKNIQQLFWATNILNNQLKRFVQFKTFQTYPVLTYMRIENTSISQFKSIVTS